MPFAAKTLCFCHTKAPLHARGKRRRSCTKRNARHKLVKSEHVPHPPTKARIRRDRTAAMLPISPLAFAYGGDTSELSNGALYSVAFCRKHYAHTQKPKAANCHSVFFKKSLPHTAKGFFVILRSTLKLRLPQSAKELRLPQLAKELRLPQLQNRLPTWLFRSRRAYPL